MEPEEPKSEKEIVARHARVTRSRTFRNLRSALGLSKKRVLDVGCGYGEYLAHFGAGSEGLTTTLEEVAYGKHAGLLIKAGNAEELPRQPQGAPYEAVWANNLFEHLLAPHAFLMYLKPLLTSDAVLVLGVPVVPFPGVLLSLRRFRGALASNHINFFTRTTLRLTVARAGWRVREVRPFIFQNRTLDRLASIVAPHLYVVAIHDPEFRYPPKKVKEWEGEAQYARLLALAGNDRA